ncbi:MAG: sporulation transcriptional regulator SpoIIID [Clostridia bacterium]|nr:sporulation transcriptional regulator SpoIIID [Clostridia bacterium]
MIISNERCVQEALYVIKHKATVRETAKAFGVSKSTVHKDVTERLKRVNIKLYCKVKEILNENFSVRHIRGGEATKRKYESIKNQNGNNP